jgi:hypothetical protein
MGAIAAMDVMEVVKFHANNSWRMDDTNVMTAMRGVGAMGGSGGLEGRHGKQTGHASGQHGGGRRVRHEPTRRRWTEIKCKANGACWGLREVVATSLVSRRSHRDLDIRTRSVAQADGDDAKQPSLQQAIADGKSASAVATKAIALTCHTTRSRKKYQAKAGKASTDAICDHRLRATGYMRIPLTLERHLPVVSGMRAV